MVTFLETEDPLHQGQLPSHTVPGTSSPSATTMATTSNRSTITKMMKERSHPHRITSLNYVIANGDETTRFLLKKKQENYKYLTVKILKEQQQQHLAGLHFEAMYDHLLYMPSITLTLMTGILGVLVKSTLVPSDRTQTFFALCIATIAVLSTFIQSLTKQLNLGGRAGFHESASTALKKLYERTELSSREAQYNSIHKALKTDSRLSVGSNLTQVIAAAEKEDCSTDGSEEEGCNTAANVVSSPPEVDTKVDNKASDGTKESITSQFFQAVDGCNSVIPIKISHAFDMIDARVNLVNKSMLKDKKHSKVNWSEVLPAIYYQLTQTFLEYPYFPICLPQPKWSVDKALEDFKKSLESGEHNHADLASSLLDRAEIIGEKMPLIEGDNDDELV
ncbi:hypothetical protein FRACYDRAFT_238313 [Fragilariopsis cylindrus CCMP1102]|uniref:Uncharacterized protein n=1 Tax=Fragilariopsis cylindrus CCMP1102 TaxID=635003 RepID=A0A1E7FID0_9STRA|nr:hypothetical protein FRACYDRAFT_238313 [Fragilariopsis cylindrus CCMP1102]|eukprot:OEU17884.1 hypothetical protein FRACYDRAFT_238313 [Fragilariopsis cylindrus CCMP1102]